MAYGTASNWSENVIAAHILVLVEHGLVLVEHGLVLVERGIVLVEREIATATSWSWLNTAWSWLITAPLWLNTSMSWLNAESLSTPDLGRGCRKISRYSKKIVDRSCKKGRCCLGSCQNAIVALFFG